MHVNSCLSGRQFGVNSWVDVDNASWSVTLSSASDTSTPSTDASLLNGPSQDWRTVTTSIPHIRKWACCTMLHCVKLCFTVFHCVALCCTVLHCVVLCQPSLYGSRWWRPLQSKRCPDSALAQSFMLTGEGEWSCDMCCDASACYWSTPVHRKEGSLLDISLRPVSVWQHCQLGNQPNVRTPNHLLRLPITKVTKSKLLQFLLRVVHTFHDCRSQNYDCIT